MTTVVECPGGGRCGEGADLDNAEEAAKWVLAPLAPQEEITLAERGGGGIGGEAHIDALGSGSDEAKERGSEANGGISRIRR